MKRKIVVVEDDPVHRAHLGRLIHRLGHEAVMVETGADALQLVLSGRDPTLSAMILDLVMPDLDGMAVITRLRGAGYKIPIIVLVKPQAIDSALNAIHAGAQDFSVVPASFERIAVALSSLKDKAVHAALPAPSHPAGMSALGSGAERMAFDGKERHAHSATLLSPDAVLTLIDKKGQLRPLADIENDVITFALDRKQGSLTAVAEALGISRSTLYRRLEALASAKKPALSRAFGDAA